MHTWYRRGWVLAVLACLVGGQAIATLHFVLVPHHRCSAHGEWVHGDAPNGHAGSADQAAVASSAQDDEDHCSLGVYMHRQAAAQHPAPVAQSMVSHAFSPALSPALAPTYARLAVWRTAPKNSPPV